jgi:hypothetical protein
MGLGFVPEGVAAEAPCVPEALAAHSLGTPGFGDRFEETLRSDRKRLGAIRLLRIRLMQRVVKFQLRPDPLAR